MSMNRPNALPTNLSGRVVFVAGAGSAGPGWSVGHASSLTYARQGAQAVNITGTELVVDGGITGKFV